MLGPRCCPEPHVHGLTYEHNVALAGHTWCCSHDGCSGTCDLVLPGAAPVDHLHLRMGVRHGAVRGAGTPHTLHPTDALRPIEHRTILERAIGACTHVPRCSTVCQCLLVVMRMPHRWLPNCSCNSCVVCGCVPKCARARRRRRRQTFGLRPCGRNVCFFVQFGGCFLSLYSARLGRTSTKLQRSGRTRGCGAIY